MNGSHMLEVTPSASVGRQVFPSGQTRSVLGATLTPGVSSATLILRDGYSSGEVVFTAKLPASTSESFKVCHKFTKGCHVKVTPASALAYLIIN